MEYLSCQESQDTVSSHFSCVSKADTAVVALSLVDRVQL